MIKIRKADERGHVKIDWLESYHSFSFGHYYDPEFMGFRALRVINDDIVQPAKGFGAHPHDNMEIITFVLSGQLEHKDSMGNGTVINPYDVQRMSAGTGITHSEFNHSHEKLVRLLQVWILPQSNGIAPSYEQKNFPKESRAGLKLLASEQGRSGSVLLHQDADIYGSFLNGSLTHKLSKPYAYIYCHGGALEIGGVVLHDGDGAFVEGEELLNFSGRNAEFLLFELN
jgi:redox-sensitive bicupin YhaK (pirin superfamily)